MTMEIVEIDIGAPMPVVKLMATMARGEVCYCIKEAVYLKKISSCATGIKPTIFLKLECGELGFFTIREASELKVRELHPGESITIKFS